MEFKRLAEVETVEAVNDGDTVLIEQGGEIKRAAKMHVSGAGGYIMKPTAEECTYDPSTKQLIITTDCTDLAKAVEAGAHVSIVIPDGVFAEDAHELVSCPVAWACGENALVAVAYIFDEIGVIYFANGSYTPSFG